MAVMTTMPGTLAAKAFREWEGWRTDHEKRKPTTQQESWIWNLARRATRRYGQWSVITEGELFALSRYDGAILVAECDEEGDTELRLRGGGVWCQGWSSVGRYKTICEGVEMESYVGRAGRGGEPVSWVFRASGPEIDDCIITVCRQNGEQLRIEGINPFDFECPEDFSGFEMPVPAPDNGDEFVEVSDE